jgi:hypothetical protein
LETLTARKTRTAKIDAGVDYPDLCKGLEASRLEGQFRREERRKMAQADAGNHYGAFAADRQQPVNVLSLFRRIVGRQLIAKAPRFSLSTFDRQLLSVTEGVTQFGNKRIERMKLASVLRDAVTDAFYYTGIVQVGLADAATAMLSGWEVKPGEPCAWHVDPDDFVRDVYAKKIQESWFLAHKVRLPLDAVVKDDSYSKDRKNLQETPDNAFNEQGDLRTSMISRGYYNTERFGKMMTAWQIYLPMWRIVVTVKADEAGMPRLDQEAKPLRVQKWVGPYCGPYHFLVLGNVPGNAEGKGPIPDLYDLNESINYNWRKLSNQARRQKSVTASQRVKVEDAERLTNTPDGGVFLYDGTEPPLPLDCGGPSPAVFSLTEAMVKLISWMAGNLDMMGGLSPQSKTATQDKMLAQAASGMIEDYQGSMDVFTAGVIESLCWWWVRHPTMTMAAQYSPAGYEDVKVPYHITPKMRLNLDDYDVRVDPYSYRAKSPSERLQAILGAVKETYLPMAQLAMQQGVSLDMNRLFTMIGEMMDEPRLKEIFQTVEPPVDMANQGGAGMPEQPGMPASTERNYTRRSLGGDQSPGSQSNRIQNAFSQMGAQAQPSANGAGGYG